MGALVAILAVALSGLLRLEHDPDVLVYFDPAGADRTAFQTVEDRFGRVNEVVYVVRSRDGAPLDADALGALDALEAGLAAVDGIAATRSALDLLPPGTPADSRTEALATAAERAGRSIRALVSADRTVAVAAGEALRFAREGAGLGSAAGEARRIVAEATALRDRVVATTPGVEVLMTGRLVIDETFRQAGADEMNWRAGVQVAVIYAVLVIALRSWRSAAALMALNTAATVLTMGALGWAGVTLEGLASSMPVVLLGVGVATGVHIVLSWQRHAAAGAGRRNAVATAMSENALPVTLSVVTTMIAFLCLNIAVSPPFRQLGNTSAFGLVLMLGLTFTLLPALLLALPVPAVRRTRASGLLGGLARLTLRRRVPVLLLAAIAIGGSLLALERLSFDDVFAEYFDERYEVRRATDLFEEKLVGTTILTASLPAPRAGGADDPAFRADVDAFTEWLGEQPGVSAVGGPDSRGDEGPVRGIDETRSHARAEIVLRGVSSADTLAFTQAAEARAAGAFGPDAIVTGLPVLSARLSVESGRAMFLATLAALLAISLVLLWLLRSVRLGLAALLPNLAPVVMAFGAWALLIGEVSFAATIVSTLTFGIVVDDTVHFLLRYRALRAEGLSPPEAVERTMRTVGVALVVTSLAIVSGFVAFAWSGFLVNQHFGLLSALTIGAALIADLVFLPALLATVDRGERVHRRSATMVRDR